MNASLTIFPLLLTFIHVFSKFTVLVCSTLQPFCSLHLQLQISENPYLSGSISTKSSAPGIIVATGMIYRLLTTLGPTNPPCYHPTRICAIPLQWSSRVNGSGLFGQQKGGQNSIRQVVIRDSKIAEWLVCVVITNKE